MSESGSSSLAASTFVGEDGTILWSRLATTLVGGALTVFGIGLAGVWNAVFQGAISLVNGVASFGAGVVGKAGEALSQTIGLSWGLATAAISGVTGLWVPVAAIGVVLAYLYILRWSDG